MDYMAVVVVGLTEEAVGVRQLEMEIAKMVAMEKGTGE